MNESEKKNNVEEEVAALEKKASLYAQVFYGKLSPLELGEMSLDLTEKLNEVGADVRKRKLLELDAYDAEHTKIYVEINKLLGIKPNLGYLMDNGFGIGAGDLFYDADLDVLIERDEQIIKARSADAE